MNCGNLHQQVTAELLQSIFAEAGHVSSAKVIIDRQTGLPRGFGFLEMETKLEGQKAISMLNGKDFDGRTLTVNEARPQQRGGRGGGGGRGYR
ncbi:MAG: RNA recognition motif domain-containing protein [Thermodesulfobacteriota bacterium]